MSTPKRKPAPKKRIGKKPVPPPAPLTEANLAAATQKAFDATVGNATLVDYRRRLLQQEEAYNSLVERANREIDAANERARLAMNNCDVAMQHLANAKQEIAELKGELTTQKAVASTSATFEPKSEIAMAHDLLDTLPTRPPRFIPSLHGGPGAAPLVLTLCQRISRMQR